MKKTYSKISRIIRLLTLGLTILLVISCDKDIEVFNADDLGINAEFPDLRYSNIADEYNYPASMADTDSFEVKSLYHKWEIISATNSTWCQANPNSGEAGKLYNIGLIPTDNTVLDDRTDTLILRSEGWLGKSFVIYQKGTAFLRTVVENSTLAEYVGDKISFDIESNQDWTAMVDDNIDWMEIEGSAASNGNGSITMVSTKENGSLRKEGMVYIFDRHDILTDSVTIYQNGIYLEFTTIPEQVPMTGDVSEVNISSNSNWKITIPESAKEWISADKTAGNNNETVNFTIAKNTGLSRSAYVLIESDPLLVSDSVLFSQLGAIPITEEYFFGNGAVTFNSDGSATLYAPPKSGSKTLKSKISDFSYGKYTVNFSNIQIARTSSTMLMCITAPDQINGGISWGAVANPSYSDGWASEYWVSDSFGSKKRQRVDNDILRDDIKKYIIDIRKSETPGMIDIDYYINDQLLVSTEGLDGFADGEPMCITFWIYNYYDKENPAIFEPGSLIYEPYNY